MTSQTHSTTPLSTDLRERVINAVEGGMSCREAARVFGIAPSTAIKWVDRWRRTGSYERCAMGGDKHSHRIEGHAEAILGKIDEVPDITIDELVDWLGEARGFRSSHGAVWRFLDRHGLTFKKKRRTRASSNALTS